MTGGCCWRSMPNFNYFTVQLYKYSLAVQMYHHSRRSDRSSKTVPKLNFPLVPGIMKHVVQPLLAVMSIGAAVVLVSGSLGPVSRRDLRYRPNNGFTYQYTSVHSGIEGDVAKAVSYQHRLEQIHDVTRVVPAAKPTARTPSPHHHHQQQQQPGSRLIPAAPVAVAVVAVKAARGPQERAAVGTSKQPPRFPTRQANNGRRTTVDISQQQQQPAVAHSHAQVQQYH